MPYWAKDPKIAYKTINARVETVDSAPSYRQASPLLDPCDGFFEWKKVLGGKIPYSMSMKDDSPFVLAGLWEGWKDPANDEWLHYLHDDHWWIELVRAGDPYPDAGHPTGRASRGLAIR